MDQDAEYKRNSPVQMSSPKDKAFFSCTSRSHKLHDRVSPVRSEKPIERLHPDAMKTNSAHVGLSCSSKISRNPILRARCQAEFRGVEELVKYMSEVPAYLQLLERGNTNQEKALNMGVLDWGHLQKWTDRRRPLKNQLEKNSTSSCNFPLPCGRSTGMNFDKMQQLPLPSHSGLPIEKDGKKWDIHKNTFQQFPDFLNSEIISSDTSKSQQQQQLHMLGLIKKQNHKSDTSCAREKANSSTSNDSINSSQEVDTSLSTASECEIPSSSEIKEKEDHGSRLRSSHVQMSLHENDHFCTKEGIAHFRTRNSQPFDGLLVYQKDITDVHPRLSSDTSVSGNEVWMSDGGHFSGLILPEDASFSPLYSDVPHSCPLPFKGCELSGTIPFASGDCTGASPDMLAFMPRVDVPKTFRFRCNLEKSDDITSQTPKLITTWRTDCVPVDVVEAATAKTRESLHSLNWASRCSSLKELQVNRPSTGSALADEPAGDKATATSRARRSPLRRMLDPLLKPRLSMRCPESTVNTPSRFVRRLSFSDKCRPKGEVDMKSRQDASPKESVSSSGQEARRLTFSSWACESKSVLQDEKRERSKMQGLLRLAWKNDLPLLTFSVNDMDILVATRKKNYYEMKNTECVYTFYYVRENKKKSGGWINHGSKSKSQDLVTKVVGRMNVSNSHSDTRFSALEFVLYGTEIRPTTSEAPQILPVSEIAAIVVQSPKENANVHSDALHPTNRRMISELENRNMSVSINSSIIAILPSEIHGFSEGGGPSPLIQRWKSGGSCDCGGWDVGCSLAILTEKLKDGQMSGVDQSSCGTVDTHRTELIIQSGCKKDGPVFSLVPFNEGLFTVDFDESISMLQAFSICTAILHRRNPSTPSKLHNTLQMFTADSPLRNPAATHGKAPAMYVPNRPPLSPVGRA